MIFHPIGQLAAAGNAEHFGRDVEITSVDVLENRQCLLQVFSDLSAGDLAGIQHFLPEVEQALQALAVAE